MEESLRIKEFLSGDRLKLISVRGVEKAVGAPRSTLSLFLLGERKLSRKYTEKIVKVLNKIGYREYEN